MTLALLAAAVGGCTFAAALLVLAPRRSWVRERLAPHVDALPPGPAAERRPRLTARVGAAGLAGTRLERLLARTLGRAGSGRTPAELLWATAGAGVLAALAVSAAGGPGVAAVAALLAGAFAPHAVLHVRAARRARAFDGDLPDLLEMLAASLRVGHSFEQSLRTVAESVDEPAASELRRALGEIRLGRPSAEALTELGERLSSVDMPFVTTAVEVQSQVGGSLADLLGVLTESVRERQQFRRNVRTLTAMGRASAAVLSVLPVAIAALLSLISPGYMRPLWQTATGRMLLGVAIAMILVGAAILKQIVAVRS